MTKKPRILGNDAGESYIKPGPASKKEQSMFSQGAKKTTVTKSLPKKSK